MPSPRVLAGIQSNGPARIAPTPTVAANNSNSAPPHALRRKLLRPTASTPEPSVVLAAAAQLLGSAHTLQTMGCSFRSLEAAATLSQRLDKKRWTARHAPQPSSTSRPTRRGFHSAGGPIRRRRPVGRLRRPARRLRCRGRQCLSDRPPDSTQQRGPLSPNLLARTS